MLETISVAPFRRVTPGIVASAKLAMASDVPDTSKGEIALLLKRAAPMLGIDGTTYQVMDILLGMSRADDWKGRGRPIVAISNAKLAEYTMRSERTVMRCLRKLVEIGIAAYRDSSTGRRFVNRNTQGEISLGFGIDFTPSRVRLEELKLAVEHYHAKLAKVLADKRDIARLSRAIADIYTAFPDLPNTWNSHLAELDALGLEPAERADAYRAAHAKLVHSSTSEFHSPKLSCEGDIDVTPYTYTKYKSYSNGNDETPPKLVDTKIDTESPGHSTTHTGTLSDEVEKKPITAENKQTSDVVQVEALSNVTIGLLQVACRESQEMTRTPFGSWSELGKAGDTLRRMIGLSDPEWSNARDRVGLFAASAIVATLLEKSIRQPDQISRPNGYFRAMVDRAVTGKLNLARSLFGLAQGTLGAE
jgi:replication initiation protein RepC